MLQSQPLKLKFSPLTSVVEEEEEEEKRKRALWGSHRCAWNALKLEVSGTLYIAKLALCSCCCCWSRKHCRILTKPTIDATAAASGYASSRHCQCLPYLSCKLTSTSNCHRPRSALGGNLLPPPTTTLFPLLPQFSVQKEIGNWQGGTG